MITADYLDFLRENPDLYTYRQLAGALGVPYDSVMKDANPEITTALDMNKERMKRELRRSWMISDSPKLQENCYYLMADNEEMVRLGREPVEADQKQRDPLLNFMKKLVKKD